MGKAPLQFALVEPPFQLAAGSVKRVAKLMNRHVLRADSAIDGSILMCDARVRCKDPR